MSVKPEHKHHPFGGRESVTISSLKPESRGETMSIWSKAGRSKVSQEARGGTRFSATQVKCALDVERMEPLDAQGGYTVPSLQQGTPP